MLSWRSGRPPKGILQSVGEAAAAAGVSRGSRPPPAEDLPARKGMMSGAKRMGSVGHHPPPHGGVSSFSPPPPPPLPLLPLPLRPLLLSFRFFDDGGVVSLPFSQRCEENHHHPDGSDADAGQHHHYYDYHPSSSSSSFPLLPSCAERTGRPLAPAPPQRTAWRTNPPLSHRYSHDSSGSAEGWNRLFPVALLSAILPDPLVAKRRRQISIRLPPEEAPRECSPPQGSSSSVLPLPPPPTPLPPLLLSRVLVAWVSPPYPSPLPTTVGRRIGLRHTSWRHL